eukprot:scaffold912_cov18-Prasinocladus_malaysianus.AAC.1
MNTEFLIVSSLVYDQIYELLKTSILDAAGELTHVKIQSDASTEKRIANQISTRLYPGCVDERRPMLSPNKGHLVIRNR